MDKPMTTSVEQRETRGVSPATLVRGAGLLAIAAGASTVLAPLVHPESPQSPPGCRCTCYTSPRSWPYC